MESAREAIGLCHTCQHVRRIESRRGSVFILCEKSVTEPETFSRYPRLPVRVCVGYLPDGPLPPEKGG